MNYESAFTISNEALSRLNYALNHEPANAGECFTEEQTTKFCIKFRNGNWMEIVVNGKEYEEGRSNKAWTEAILYERNGVQVDASGRYHRLEGTWTLQHNGDLYIAFVMPEDKTASSAIIEDMTVRQKMWWRAILQNAAAEYTGFARNMHIAAMGSTNQDESVQFELAADEARDFSNKLNKLINCLDD